MQQFIEESQHHLNELYQHMNTNDLQFNSNEKLQIIISSGLGMVFGIVSTWFILPIIIEITFTTFFALYFGLLFIGVGIITLIKNIGDEQQSFISHGIRRNIQIGYSFMMIIAGLLCFFLQKLWYARIYFIFKLPIFLHVCICVSICTVFSLVDIINYMVGVFQQDNLKSIVESKLQQLVLTIFTLTLGVYLGLLFSIDDLSDNKYTQFLKYEMINSFTLTFIPLLLGFLFGVINEILRIRENQIFNKPLSDPFTNEI